MNLCMFFKGTCHGEFLGDTGGGLTARQKFGIMCGKT